MVDQFFTAKNDIVFKVVMVRNEKVLKKILEVILDITIDEIILLDKEILPYRIRGKNRILDLLVKTEDRVINIELNANKKYYHNYRNASYLFGLYNNSINKSDEYDIIVDKEFIGINFSYGMSKDIIIENIYYIQTENNEKYIKNFKIIEFNMDKIEKSWYTLSKLEQEKYKYLKMLNLTEEELLKFCKGDEVMEEFEKEVKKVNDEDEYKFFLSDERDAEMLRKTEEKIRKRELAKLNEQLEEKNEQLEEKNEQLEEKNEQLEEINEQLKKQKQKINNSIKKLLELNVNIEDISTTLDIPINEIENIAENM